MSAAVSSDIGKLTLSFFLYFRQVKKRHASALSTLEFLSDSSMLSHPWLGYKNETENASTD